MHTVEKVQDEKPKKKTPKLSLNQLFIGYKKIKDKYKKKNGYVKTSKK